MKYFLSILLTLLLVAEAAAYIDPGTGGAIIGSAGTIIAAFFGLIGMILLKYFISPVKRIFSKVNKLLKKQ